MLLLLTGRLMERQRERLSDLMRQWKVSAFGEVEPVLSTMSP
jgi:hypothetical protein